MVSKGGGKGRLAPKGGFGGLPQYLKIKLSFGIYSADCMLAAKTHDHQDKAKNSQDRQQQTSKTLWLGVTGALSSKSQRDHHINAPVNIWKVQPLTSALGVLGLLVCIIQTPYEP